MRIVVITLIALVVVIWGVFILTLNPAQNTSLQLLPILILFTLVVGGIVTLYLLKQRPKPVFTCAWCNYNGPAKSGEFNNDATVIFILLFLCGIFPAILFAYYVTNQKQCPNCKAIIPLERFRK